MKVLAVLSDLFFTVKIIDAAKRAGIGVQCAKDGAIAFEKAKAQIDTTPLIVVDLNCADAKPLEFIRSIKADPQTRNIPLIGFVSHVQVDLKRAALEAGADEVFARSVLSESAERIIRSLAIQAPAADPASAAPLPNQ